MQAELRFMIDVTSARKAEKWTEMNSREATQLNENVRPIAVAAAIVSSICAVVLLLFAMVAVLIGNIDWIRDNTERAGNRVAAEQTWFMCAALVLALAAGTVWKWSGVDTFLAAASLVMMWVFTADEMKEQWPFFALTAVPATLALLALFDAYRSSHQRPPEPRDITEGLGKSWLSVR